MNEIRKSKVWGMLVLMRPANLITAIADILAGFAVGGLVSSTGDIWQIVGSHQQGLLLLCLSTIGLYGGGVVFNDVFDFELDKVERPERPLPSGKVSKLEAILLGLALLLLGIIAAFVVGWISGVLAICIAILALLYDGKSKHHVFWGPVNMAACRGGNLLLGVSIFVASLGEAAYLVIFPLIYIGSITLISQGEVQGGNKRHLLLAILGYSLVFSLIALLGGMYPVKLIYSLPFLALFAALVLPPLLKAYRTTEAMDIRKAVKAGVICLIVLNASLASGFAGLGYGLLILTLLPVSIGLGKLFSVT
ncbi:MAG: UbiA-like protein EboC [Bacteroidota bacterium]